MITEGSWLKKGHLYLFDATKGQDGALLTKRCGSTADIDSNSIQDFLGYLRSRQRGEFASSLTVVVRDEFSPVENVDVTIRSEQRMFSTTTDALGNASFSNIEPGTYSLQATRQHYQLNEERVSDHVATVIAGTCPSALMLLKADGGVSGVVRDVYGAPISALPIELLEIRNGSQQVSDLAWFQSRTDNDGKFTFDSVSPGRYYLGTNLLEFEKAARVPPVFFPGLRDRNGAIPIDVRLGELTDNLLFTFPDFGPMREITFLVIDDTGHVVNGAIIGNDIFTQNSGDTGAIEAGLRTDKTGQVISKGYEALHYRVMAMTDDPDYRQSRFSEAIEIPPGKGPIRITLVLKKSSFRSSPQH